MRLDPNAKVLADVGEKTLLVNTTVPAPQVLAALQKWGTAAGKSVELLLTTD